MALPKYLDQSLYEETKDFMRRLWRGQMRGALAYNIVVPAGNALPEYEPESDCIGEKLLKQCCDGLSQRDWGHDHAVPLIQPNNPWTFRGDLIAMGFGSPYNEACENAAPLIHSADEIDSLDLEPDIDTGPMGMALEAIRYVVDRTEGKVPIQMYNAGGPMDIASMVLENTELMTALYTHPKQVHRLLDACTETYIRFYKAQQAIMPEWCPVIAEDMYVPPEDCILCGEDWLAAMSPEMALEFEVPYINRISDAFGGVAIHSCGSFEHQFELLKKHVKNLRGIYFNAGECSFEAAVSVFRGTDVVLMPRWEGSRPFRYESRLDFVRKLRSAKTDDVTVYLIAGWPSDPTVAREADPMTMCQEILSYINTLEADKAPMKDVPFGG